MTTQERRLKAIIQFRRGLEQEWAIVNPVLRLGEPAFSVDIGRLKIGDGVHPWRELSYIGGDGDIEVDDELSLISVHPVQNKVITQAILSIQDELNVLDGKVVYGTTEYWDGLPDYVGSANVIYVYVDGFNYKAHNIVRFKVGNGQTLLKNLPYTDMVYYDHISDPIIHISQKEREFWNNKVSCNINGENIIFTTGKI